MIVHFTEKQQYELRLSELKIQDSSEFTTCFYIKLLKLRLRVKGISVYGIKWTQYYVYVRKLGRIGKLICKIYLKRAVWSLILLCVMKH